jgi:beta-galactosidase
MKIGTYYYPEQWPRSQWERDFDNMAAMGLKIVHMGEFAWFSMEPAEGDIRLDWLGECVEMAASRQLDVILCTPTASPPVWLVQKHPQILIVDRHGGCQRFGGRRHYSPTSPDMHEAAKRIVTALAERFAGHRSVIGWQIDNEYGGAFDQNDHAHAAFRQWLQDRHGTLDELNRAWGCQFWNTYYTDFNQILLPVDRDPRYANPHQHLDASRFWSNAYARFNKLQADILKAHLKPLPDGRLPFVTTNFMPFHPDCNPADMAEDLSLMSWDSYPVGIFADKLADETFRIGNPAQIGLMHDVMNSHHNRWALMEIQPGQVNWAEAPVLLYPGSVRLWLWTALAHGAEFVTTYRYRQPRFGIELFHHGLVGPDGTTPSPGGREFVQAIDEIKHLDLDLLNKAPSTCPVGGKVGFLFDFEQLWYFLTLPQAPKWNLVEFWQTWYAALMRLGLSVEVIHPGRPWPADLSLIVAPAIQMVDGDLITRLEQHVQRGGHLLLTCRSALMDRTGQLWEGPSGKPIVNLIGGAIEAYDALPRSVVGTVEMDGKKYPWDVWGDLLYADPDTKVLAKYADQFYAGAAAILQKSHGDSIVTYCGVHPNVDLAGALIEKLAGQMKIPVTPLPPRVQWLRRGDYNILLNYQDKPMDVPASKSARIIVGSRQIEPAGVAVWQE